MYKTNRQIKQEARFALAGKWGIAIAMNLIVFMISGGITFLARDQFSIVELVCTIIGLILETGILSFYLKLCCGQKQYAQIQDIFYGFQCRPVKILLLNLLKYLYFLPGSFVLGILVVLSVFVMLPETALYTLVYNPYYATAELFLPLLPVWLILFLLFLVYAFYIELTYSQTLYLLLDYPDLPTVQIWQESKQLMRGNRMRLLGLEFSFIPWAILSVITCGIGLIWLIPYAGTAHTVFYLDLIRHQNPYKDTASKTEPGDSNPFQDPGAGNADGSKPASEGTDYSGIDMNTFR